MCRFHRVRLLLSFLVLVAGLIVRPTATIAQDSPNEVFASRYGGFSFEHPRGWVVIERLDQVGAGGIAFMDEQESPQVIGIVLDPFTLQTWGMMSGEECSLSELTLTIRQHLETQDDSLRLESSTEVMGDDRLSVMVGSAERLDGAEGNEEAVLFAIQIEANVCAALFAHVIEGGLGEYERVLRAMVMSFSYEPEVIFPDSLSPITPVNLDRLSVIAAWFQMYELNAVDFSPLDPLIAYGAGSAAIVKNVVTGEIVTELGQNRDYSYRRGAISFGPDGRSLAFVEGWLEDNAHVWDLKTGERVKAFRVSDTIPDVIRAISLRTDISDYPEALTIGAAKVWFVSVPIDQDPEALIMVSSNDVEACLSDDARTMALESEGGSIELWNMDQREQLKVIGRSSSSAITSMALNSDSSLLAIGTIDGELELWNVETGTELIRMAGHVDWIADLAFSRDGKILATVGGGYDHTVKLWGITEFSTIR